MGSDKLLTEGELRQVVRQTSLQIRDMLGKIHLTLEHIAPPDKRDEDEKLDRLAAELYREFYRMMRLANNLAEEADPGTSNPHRNRDIVSLCESLANRIRYAAELLHVDVVFSTSVESCIIGFRWDRVERLLMNLISNSLKFTPEGGKLRLELDTDDRFVYIRVVDTGVGMTEEELAAVCRQSEKDFPVRMPPYGVGLGLPLCRRIAQEHGGDVEISSEKGVGTVATVTLEKKETKIRDLHELRYEYTGGFDHMLVELSDAIPVEGYREKYMD